MAIFDASEIIGTAFMIDINETSKDGYNGKILTCRHNIIKYMID